MTQNIKYLCLHICSISILFHFAGCSGGGNSSSNLETATITGVVQAGRVSNATVTIYSLKNGQRGQSLGQTTTNSDGSFSISVNKLSSPVEIVAKAGTYKDEATGRTVTMGSNDELTAVLEDVNGKKTTPVTPVTTLVSERVKTQIQTGNINEGQFTSAQNAVEQEIAQLYGVTKDVIKSIPNNPTAPGDSQTNEGKGAYLLATLSQYLKDKNLGPDQGTNPFDALRELAKDIKADGKLDGMNEGTPVSAAFEGVSTGWGEGMTRAANNLKTNQNTTAFGSFDRTAMNINQFTTQPDNKIETVSKAEQEQFTLCHIPPGYSANGYSIMVGANAKAAHLAHGDSMGLCAPPTLTGVSPVTGPLTGGKTLNLTGTGFLGVRSITVGGTLCEAPKPTTGTQATCVLPAKAAGSYNVVITNSDGQRSTQTINYIYQDAPSLASISPSSGTPQGGELLTLTGSNFLTGLTVTVGDSPCVGGTAISSTVATCTLPAKLAGNYDVIITNPDAQTTGNLVKYTYDQCATKCGGTGNGCYDNSAAITNACATLQDGTETSITPKIIDYKKANPSCASNCFYVWKDRSSTRILNATGLWAPPAATAGWQKKLNPNGVGENGDLTDAAYISQIAGRACPYKTPGAGVFINFPNHVDNKVRV